MNNRNLQIIVILTSVLIIIVGFLIEASEKVVYTYINLSDIKAILFSVGTSLLASSVFAIFTLKIRSDEEKKLIFLKKIGLTNFYIEREEITAKCTQLFENAERVDIIAIRLKTLLEKHEERLTNLLKTKAIRIRILLPDPDSNSAKTIEDLLGTKESIRSGLKNVLEWQTKLKSHKLIGSLEIKYSEKLISSMYQRIDDTIFSGPYMSKKNSQGTFTIECDASGEYGQSLVNYFEVRFSEASISLKKRPFVVEFLGMPGAGKTTCVNTLKKKYSEIVSHSNEDVECFSEDTPYVFNDRLIDSLSKKIHALRSDDVLFLDRGIEDLKIWLKTHHEVKNLTDEEYKSLSNMIPHIPSQFKQYRILFIMKPVFTLKRREIRRRVDEWAIKNELLNHLYRQYKKKGSSNIIVVDSTLPLAQMENKVIQIIDKIFEEENNRF